MVLMDLKEAKLREEIEFWAQFIEQWKKLTNEPVEKIALESLEHAEKKLRRYLLAREIQRSRKDNRGTRDGESSEASTDYS